MITRLTLSLTLVLAWWGASSHAMAADEASTPSESVSYYRDIRPIFQAQCHGCHQPAKAKGGYVMTAFERLLAMGDSEEKAVVPEKPEESFLLEQITPVDGEAEMPQKADPLPPEQIDLIRRWIAQGAVDDTPANARQRYDQDHPPVYKMPPVVTSLDFSPDGQLLAVSGFHEVLLHQADGSGLVARLVGLSERIESVRFSPDGTKLAVTGGLPARMGEVQIWDVAKAKLDLSVPITFDTVYGASWSPDGTIVAFGCSDNTVRAINAKTGEELLFQGSHSDWVLDTVFSTNGTHVVSVGRDQTAKLIELKTQRFIDNITSITPGALKGGIYSVERHPKRDEVVMGSADGVPQIFRMNRVVKRVIGDNSNLIRKFPAMPGRIFSTDYSPDGKRIVAGSSIDGQGYVNVYASDIDSSLSKELIKIFEKVASSRSGDERKKVDEYQTRNVKLLSELKVEGGIYAVSFNSKGTVVAAAGGEGVVRLIDAETGSLLKAFLPVPLPEEAQKEVIALSVEPVSISLDSPFTYNQMLVTGWRASGEGTDVTRLVSVKAEDEAIVEISTEGLVRPRKNGQTTLVVTLVDRQIRVPVEVKGLGETLVPDFLVDVAPVISKLGCNAGTCHGAKDGKNGFKLSLRGYDSLYDVRAFTDDLASRRVNFASPDDSLMLLKATAGVPHEGGQRMKPEDNYYKIIRDWIAAGCELNTESARVKTIQLSPQNPVIQTIGDAQQMRVIATYTDGKSKDVTAEAFIDSGDLEIAVTKDGGLVTSIRRGEAPILARFEGAYAATTMTVMGDRSGFVWEDQPANNKIDELAAAKWKRLKILPSELCTDEEFLRRIYLDLTGLPPTADQVRQFLGDDRDSQIKRDTMIDSLIGQDDYIDYWSNKWADLLQVNRKFLGAEGAATFRKWIREEIAQNTPYNKFVQKILTATGSNKENPAASYYKVLREPAETMENTTHLFLATRFNCNKCHDHPFERWTQDQYYEMAANFAQVGLKKDPASGDKRIGGTAVEGAKPLYEIIFDKKEGEVKHDRTGQVAAPGFPYKINYKSEEGSTRRERLASWITSADNQYFARSYVNRLWGYLTGVGVIEPLDDIRAGNPPSNPELLDWLTSKFIESNFNVRELIATICKSRVYQLSIKTHRWNEDDAINFSHAKPRRLPAEVLYDAIYKSLGVTSKIPGVPEGTRAAQLPDVGVKLPDGFLGTLGRPARESACECERSNDLQLGSVMALVTGPTVENAVSSPGNAIDKLVKEVSDDRKLVQELYLRILNRPARDKEVDIVLGELGQIQPDHDALLADLENYKKDLGPIQEARKKLQEKDIENARNELNAYKEEIAPREADLDAKQKDAIAKAEEELKKYETTLPEKLVEWESKPDLKTKWNALTPRLLQASMGSKLELDKDQAVFVSGNTGQGDYTVVANSDLENITALKIEALADDRLPKKGPGRFDADGNFVLTELDVFWVPHAELGDDALVRNWAFDGEALGWASASECEVSAKDNVLTVKSTGKDPHIEASLEEGQAPKGDLILEIRSKANRALAWQLFWADRKKTDYDEDRSLTLNATDGLGEWQTHRFYFKSSAELASLRLDPGAEEGEVHFESIRLFKGKQPKAVKIDLHNAKADFSQKGYDVKTAIDGKRPDRDNGWAASPKLGVDHMATFEFKKPLDSSKGGELKFVLNQNYNSKSHSLGKFRISVTGSGVPVDFGVPESIGSILEIAADQRSDEQKKILMSYYRGRDEEVAKREKAVAEAKKPRPADPKLKAFEAKLARTEKPLPPDPKLQELERAVKLSTQQLENKRLTAAQDLSWALINNPAFLFNH